MGRVRKSKRETDRYEMWFTSFYVYVIMNFYKAPVNSRSNEREENGCWIIHELNHLHTRTDVWR
jgi:hypothetical protein